MKAASPNQCERRSSNVTYLSIGLCLFAIAVIGYTAMRIVKEPRSSVHGLLIMFSIVTTWIAAVITSVAVNPESELSLLIAYGPVVGYIMAVVACAVLLLVNGVIVIRKEGLRIATLVPTVFGLLLLAAIASSFIGLFALSTMSSFFLYALQLIFLTIPLSMIVIQLVGFTLYAMLYSKLGDARGADVIVVHGAGLNGEDLTPLLRSRVDKGIEIYREQREAGFTPILVLSGGQGPDEVISEAEAMARYARRQGVNEEHLILEDRSTTTEENVRYVVELLKDYFHTENLTKEHKIVFVTSDYHVLRTATLTRNVGVPGSVIGARTAMYYVPAGFLREFVATLKHFAKANLATWLAITALLLATVGALAYISAQQKYPLDENGNEIRPTVERTAPTETAPSETPAETPQNK